MGIFPNSNRRRVAQSHVLHSCVLHKSKLSNKCAAVIALINIEIIAFRHLFCFGPETDITDSSGDNDRRLVRIHSSLAGVRKFILPLVKISSILIAD